MSESAKLLKANKLIAGSACAWCSVPIEFGQDVAICQSCDATHHVGCWSEKAGCSTAECVHAPLERLETPEIREAPTGMAYCPHCNEIISREDEVCVHCRKVTTPDGQYHGPKRNAPDAVASMVWGIVGLFFCGLILGIVAISKSNSAKKAIEADPCLSGGGYATAGMVLGIIDLVFWGLWMIMRFMDMSAT